MASSRDQFASLVAFETIKTWQSGSTTDDIRMIGLFSKARVGELVGDSDSTRSSSVHHKAVLSPQLSPQSTSDGYLDVGRLANGAGGMTRANFQSCVQLLCLASVSYMFSS